MRGGKREARNPKQRTGFLRSLRFRLTLSYVLFFSVLLRRGQPTPERLQVGDLTLDCIRRKVTRSGENVELAPKEFSILEYLMRNRGRPLSRTMIVEHVWDMDYDGLTNIVDVYIRHLRSKIDEKWPDKMIQTVRGIGYMLDSTERPAEKAI